MIARVTGDLNMVKPRIDIEQLSIDRRLIDEDDEEDAMTANWRKGGDKKIIHRHRQMVKDDTWITNQRKKVSGSQVEGSLNDDLMPFKPSKTP
jgi:ribosomal protein S1